MTTRALFLAIATALALPAAAPAAVTVGSSLPEATSSFECLDAEGCTFVPRTIPAPP